MKFTEVQKVIRKHYKNGSNHSRKLNWEKCGQEVRKLAAEAADKALAKIPDANYMDRCAAKEAIEAMYEREYESYFSFGPAAYDWINGNTRLTELLKQTNA
jgi:hypothetical protein